MQSHFVVVFDHETRKFWLDNTQEVKFTLFVEGTDEYALDDAAARALFETLPTLKIKEA